MGGWEDDGREGSQMEAASRGVHSIDTMIPILKIKCGATTTIYNKGRRQRAVYLMIPTPKSVS